MFTVDIHEAKTHLSKLIDGAVKGKPFIIAKAGKPLVRVVAFNAPELSQAKRRGFLAGRIDVPDDFDEIGHGQIETMFSGDS